MGTAIVIGWQAWETRKAAKGAQDSAQAALAQIEFQKSKERARVVICRAECPKIFPPEPILDGGRALKVRVLVENLGGSRAFNVRAYGMVDIVSDPKGGAHEVGFLRHFPRIVDLRNEPYPLDLGGFGREFEGVATTGDSTVITEKLAQQIHDGEAFIKATGLLVYEDIFADTNETPFLLVWKSFGNDAGEEWPTDSKWFECST